MAKTRGVHETETPKREDKLNATEDMIERDVCICKNFRSIVQKLQSLSDKLTAELLCDSYDQFSKYISSLLRGLPNKEALNMKRKIVNDVIELLNAQERNNPEQSLTRSIPTTSTYKIQHEDLSVGSICQNSAVINSARELSPSTVCNPGNPVVEPSFNISHSPRECFMDFGVPRIKLPSVFSSTRLRGKKRKEVFDESASKRIASSSQSAANDLALAAENDSSSNCSPTTRQDENATFIEFEEGRELEDMKQEVLDRISLVKQEVHDPPEDDNEELKAACDICFTQCLTKDELAEHFQREHHGSTKEKPDCDQTVSRKKEVQQWTNVSFDVRSAAAGNIIGDIVNGKENPDPNNYNNEDINLEDMAAGTCRMDAATETCTVESQININKDSFNEASTSTYLDDTDQGAALETNASLVNHKVLNNVEGRPRRGRPPRRGRSPCRGRPPRRGVVPRNGNIRCQMWRDIVARRGNEQPGDNEDFSHDYNFRERNNLDVPQYQLDGSDLTIGKMDTTNKATNYGPQLNIDDAYKHYCSVCNCGYKRKDHLLRHMRTAHSVQRFVCFICGAALSRLDHLRRHIRCRHHDTIVLPNAFPFEVPQVSSTLNLEEPSLPPTFDYTEPSSSLKIEMPPSPPPLPLQFEAPPSPPPLSFQHKKPPQSTFRFEAPPSSQIDGAPSVEHKKEEKLHKSTHHPQDPPSLSFHYKVPPLPPTFPFEAPLSSQDDVVPSGEHKKEEEVHKSTGHLEDPNDDVTFIDLSTSPLNPK